MFLRIGFGALAIGLISAAPATATEPGIQVIMHQAKIVKLSRPADTVIVGNRRALARGEIEFSDEVASLLKSREQAGESPLVVAVGEQPAPRHQRDRGEHDAGDDQLRAQRDPCRRGAASGRP